MTVPIFTTSYAQVLRRDRQRRRIVVAVKIAATIAIGLLLAAGVTAALAEIAAIRAATTVPWTG